MKGGVHNQGGEILLPQYRGPDWSEVGGTQVGEPSLELRANEAPLVHFAVLPFNLKYTTLKQCHLKIEFSTVLC